MAEQLSGLTFWRLFHSLLRHGNGKAETERAQEVYEWTVDNMTQLRKSCVDYELDLVGVIGNLSRDSSTLPTYDILKERVSATENSEGALEALKEYEELQEKLTVHHTPELEVVLKEHTENFERGALTAVLEKAKRIANGKIEDKKRKLSGVKDALNYIMEQVEQGIIVRSDKSGLNRPIVVQKEAEEIQGDYDRLLNRGFIETGFPLIRLRPSNFMGILGHAGQGKSTVGRFMLYTMAAAGKNVCEITLENDAEVERNKFILLHAHNPDFFGDECATLTYENFINGRLTARERDLLAEVGRDFKHNVGGHIFIKQPHEASDIACKNAIESFHRHTPIDVAMIDYIQLIDPPARNADERKNKMSTMIKDWRQYALNFDGSRKLVLISPVQGNEEGFKYAQDHEGEWPKSASGINTDKELARSMDVIIGIFQKDQIPNAVGGQDHQVVFSNPKDRDKPEFSSFLSVMSGCGWFRLLGGATSTTVKMNAEETMNDIIGDEIPL